MSSCQQCYANWRVEVHSWRRQGKVGRWRMGTFFPFPGLEITFLSNRAKHRLLISDFDRSHLDSIHGFYPLNPI